MPILRFGTFALDTDSAELQRGPARTTLTPKLRDLLVFLLDRPGRVLTREEILSGVWPGVFVTDNALSFQISQLRNALGPDGSVFLETVPRAGYRWNTAPERDWGREGEPPPPRQGIRVGVQAFTVSGDLTPELGVGLAETVRMQLGLHPEILVLPAGSKDPADVTVEGRLHAERLPQGHRLRVRFRAFDAHAPTYGATLGGGTAEATAGDELALEEKIGRDIAKLLEVPLDRLTIQRLVAPVSLDAAELYWRAKALSRHGWTATREALLLLQQAIELDPKFASARTLKAQLLGLEVGYRVARDPEGNHREALREASEAVALEPNNPYARSVLGGAMADCGQLDEGAHEAAIGRDQAPSRPSTHLLLGWLYRWAGLLDRAQDAYTIAWRLDPTDWRAGVHLAYVLTLRGDAEAEVPLETLQGFGTTAETAALEMAAWRAYGLGDLEATQTFLKRLTAREPVLNYVERLKALVAARSGNLAPARAEIERHGGYADGRVRFDRAALHVAVGDREGVYAELSAAEAHGFQAPQALRFDPDLRSLSHEPAFQAIAERWEERRKERQTRWR